MFSNYLVVFSPKRVLGMLPEEFHIIEYPGHRPNCPFPSKDGLSSKELVGTEGPNVNKN